MDALEACAVKRGGVAVASLRCEVGGWSFKLPGRLKKTLSTFIKNGQLLS
jgi:hypothetical protein